MEKVKQYLLSCIILISLGLFGCQSTSTEVIDRIDEEEDSPYNEITYTVKGMDDSFLLTMDLLGNIFFKSSVPPIEFLLPPGESSYPSYGPVWLYHSQDGEFEIKVSITEHKGASGLPEYFTLIHFRTMNDDQFTEVQGYGEYSMDNQLHNIWLITHVDGIPVGPDDFSNEVPTIQWNTSTGIFMGSTGCNRIQGPFSTRDNVIYIGLSATTRMMCGKTDVSDRIAMILNQGIYKFSHEERELIFTLDGEDVLRFINVD